MAQSRQRGFLAAMEKPVSARGVEALACVALAVWVFGQIVFYRSTAAAIPWVSANNLVQFTQAIAAGCLIAAIACKGLDLEPLGIAALFCLLFATLVVWNRAHDSSLIVMALLLIAASGFDSRRLMAVYAASAIAGFAISYFLAFPLYDANGTFALEGQLLGTRAFVSTTTVACLCFSVLCALALSSDRGSFARKAVMVACVLCALALFVVFRAKRCAILVVILAGCLLADERMSRTARSFFSKREVRWAVALLPIVLFCIANDGAKFFGFDVSESAFSRLVPAYGFAAPLCFAVLYVRSVVMRREDGRQFIVWAVFALFAVYCLFETQLVAPEFNCALLLLLGGFVKPSSEVGQCGDSDGGLERGGGEAAVRNGRNVLAVALVGVLVVALAFSSVQQRRYDHADRGGVVGAGSVYKNLEQRIILSVDSDMRASVGYLNLKFTGTLELVGDADEFQVYQLRNMAIANTDASGALLYLKIPKAGLQGDFAGPWAIYLSCPSLDILQTDWAFANWDGFAAVGNTPDENMLTLQPDELDPSLWSWTWEKADGDLRLRAPETALGMAARNLLEQGASLATSALANRQQGEDASLDDATEILAEDGSGADAAAGEGAPDAGDIPDEADAFGWSDEI